MKNIIRCFEDSFFYRWLRQEEGAGSLFAKSCFFTWFSRMSSRRVERRTPAAPRPLYWAKWLLIALPFFCMISPRIEVGAIGLSRVDLRAEDLLIPLIALCFVLSSPRDTDAPDFSPAETAFLGFLIAAEISILSGIWFRTVDKPYLSFLYLLKWVEYFLVFVLTYRLVQTNSDGRIFLAGFYLLGIAVAVYGYWEHFFPLTKAVYPNYYRLFERPPFHGDANHIGGFLVIWMGFFTGIFLGSRKRLQTAVLLLSILFVFFPFIWTYSRKSYLALAGALGLSFLWVKEFKRLLLLLSLMAILGFLLPTRLSERLMDLPDAIMSPDPFHSSWTGNLATWKECLWNFERFALFGSGLGSRHRLLYESQYVMVLAETGVVGFMMFVGLCCSLARKTVSALVDSAGPMDGGMAAGWLIGFVGFLIHSGSCVSWTVTKIAIPFWFLTGVIFLDMKLRSPK